MKLKQSFSFVFLAFVTKKSQSFSLIITLFIGLLWIMKKSTVLCVVVCDFGQSHSSVMDYTKLCCAAQSI